MGNWHLGLVWELFRPYEDIIGFYLPVCGIYFLCVLRNLICRTPLRAAAVGWLGSQLFLQLSMFTTQLQARNKKVVFNIRKALNTLTSMHLHIYAWHCWSPIRYIIQTYVNCYYTHTHTRTHIMACLLSLPSEVLLQILGYLPVSIPNRLKSFPAL